MKMIRKIITIFVIPFTVFVCCKTDRTPVGLNNEPQHPDSTSHDFTWEMDTLDYPGSYQTLMDDIWGTSETNVYAAGHNDQGSRGSIWHWNGKKWQSLVNHEGPIDPLYLGPTSFSEIYGFSEDDIWIVGTRDHSSSWPFEHSGLALHYNGYGWIKKDFSIPSYFLSVWGTSGSDVWVGDFYSKIHHFNGSQWSDMDIGINAGIKSITGFSENEVYALGYELDDMSPQDSTTYHFFKYNNYEWDIVDSYVVGITPDEYTFGNSALRVINNNTFYSVGYEIYKWNIDNWEKENFPFYIHNLIDVSGSSDKNIFAVGIFGDVFHYNGQNWYQYTDLPNIHYYAVWMHDKYVFIAGHIYESTYKTIILRGIQK